MTETTTQNETNMETQKCKCGGVMHNSDDMEDPFDPDDPNRHPFWQCKQCGQVTMDTYGLAVDMRVVITDSETDDRGVIMSFDEDTHTAMVDWDNVPIRACDIDLLVPENGW